MLNTLSSLVDRHGVDVLDHLDRQVEIPIVTGPQCQGDLIVLPAPVPLLPGRVVPAAGIPVVRGENGGHTHTLVAGDGAVMWTEVPGGTLDLGVVTVPDGAVAYLAHPEHGYSGIGPGSYTIRRQREQADVIRTVAD